MAKYRLKAGTVEAMGLTSSNLFAFAKWVGVWGCTLDIVESDPDSLLLEVKTDEGIIVVENNCWLIRRPASRFEACTDIDFFARYEAVE